MNNRVLEVAGTFPHAYDDQFGYSHVAERPFLLRMEQFFKQASSHVTSHADVLRLVTHSSPRGTRDKPKSAWEDSSHAATVNADATDETNIFTRILPRTICDFAC